MSETMDKIFSQFFSEVRMTSKALCFISLIALTMGAFASPAAEKGEEKEKEASLTLFDVSLKLYDFKEEQEEKVLKAADLIRKIIVSEEFRKGILNHTYQGKKEFADNLGLTNEEIYQKIMEGSEELRPGIDGKMDIELQVYYEDTRTVGYTRPSVFRIWMNSKYLDRNGPAEVTTNMMHEWLHKLGFKHDIQHSDRRMNTVPYAVGYLMERLAKKLLLSGSL
jgi:hypothetical protein